jgi:hypothetical protein
MMLATSVLAVALAAASVAPRGFDVQTTVRTRCRPGQAAADCPRTITADVVRRRDGRQLQRLHAAFPEAARDVAPAEREHVVDVDFDGHVDIALCSGRDALGGTPSYTVYRYRPATGRFVADARLTALQSRASGFFLVDAARRRLRLEAHGGGGRTWSEYAWSARGLQLVRRSRADVVDDGRMRLVAGARRNGQWRERRWQVDADARWPAAFEAAEAALREGR